MGKYVLCLYKLESLSKILSLIEEDDLHEPLEINPHCTILPKALGSISTSKIEALLKDKNLDFNDHFMTNVSYFDNEKYDVLKFDLSGKSLFELNKILRNNFEHSNDFNTFNPHLTMCYLKKGKVQKYLEVFKTLCKNPIPLSFNGLVLSVDYNETPINVG
jgi:2'-5' RNA ligase